MKTIQRLDETCSNLKDAAKIIGDTVPEQTDCNKVEGVNTGIGLTVIVIGVIGP